MCKLMLIEHKSWKNSVFYVRIIAVLLYLFLRGIFDA